MTGFQKPLVCVLTNQDVDNISRVMYNCVSASNGPFKYTCRSTEHYWELTHANKQKIIVLVATALAHTSNE